MKPEGFFGNGFEGWTVPVKSSEFVRLEEQDRFGTQRDIE
jgi:hypothetical protein